MEALASVGSGALRILMPAVLSATHEIRAHLPDLLTGLAVAARGAGGCLRRQAPWTAAASCYGPFVSQSLLLTLALYAALAVLAFTVFLPLTVPLLLLWPSSVVHVALSVPHLALTFLRPRHEELFAHAFEEELRALDPAYADAFAGKRRGGGGGRSGATGGWAGARRPALAAARRGALSRLLAAASSPAAALQTFGMSFIPLVGPLYALVGHGGPMAVAYALDLLRPWAAVTAGAGAGADSLLAQLEKDQRFLLMGFAIPFVILSAVPILGVAAPILGQAAAAHLVHDLVSPPALAGEQKGGASGAAPAGTATAEAGGGAPTLPGSREALDQAARTANELWRWAASAWPGFVGAASPFLSFLLRPLSHLLASALDAAGLPKGSPAREQLDALLTRAEDGEGRGGERGGEGGAEVQKEQEAKAKGRSNGGGGGSGAEDKQEEELRRRPTAGAARAGATSHSGLD